MPPTDPLARLDDVDWSSLHTAYGSAVGVPDVLRALVGDDVAVRGSALAELWGSVWHQGTVYDVTPEIVPFLMGIVADHRIVDGIRAETALLLANIGAASSFVLDGRWFVAAFARDDDAPVVPDVDLDAVCRERIGAVAGALDPVLAAGPPLVRAAGVALAATVASWLSADARSALAMLGAGRDQLVATAAGVTLDLADGAELSTADLLARAAVDAESLDFLEHIPSWPPGVQAVELVRELCERSVAAGGATRS